ncbi:hypothetical protein AB0F90_16845, partial [Micromonospora chalcea]|uniref:hypothetical protein n=1 Tax=Micromonospora chalcea TaxID=1874 RepID=UPI0033CAED5F
MSGQAGAAQRLRHGVVDRGAATAPGPLLLATARRAALSATALPAAARAAALAASALPAARAAALAALLATTALPVLLRSTRTCRTTTSEWNGCAW